jgi:hypothetical protein
MAKGSETRKIVYVIVLTVGSIWLFYRTFLGPDGIWHEQEAVVQQTGEAGRVGEPSTGSRRPGATTARTAQKTELLNMDPSLRLDLLETSRAVSYGQSSRNIFQFGAVRGADTLTPDGMGEPPTQDMEPVELIPVAETTGLKFYGVARLAGQAPMRAFLTSEESILIAQPGETIADHYKVLRIGMNSIELEDIRDRTHHELVMEEE